MVLEVRKPGEPTATTCHLPVPTGAQWAGQKGEVVGRESIEIQELRGPWLIHSRDIY